MTITERLGQFYIGGEWVVPGSAATRMGVENPATEEIVGEVAIGSADLWPRSALCQRRSGCRDGQ